MIRRWTIFATVAVAGGMVVTPLLAQSDSSCPLPLARQIDSIHAFSPIASFLTSEPRCFNCHGGVNPHIEGTGNDPEDADAPPSLTEHGGGRILRQRDTAPDGTVLIESECRDCHSNMAPRRDGGPSLWMTAPSFLSFVGKDAPTLCRQIKRATGTAEHFRGHLEDDNGGNQFGRAAFAGDRGLDPQMYDIPPEPPSITHSELMQMARQWIDAMGGSFQGDERCGCEVELEGTFSQTHTSAQTAAIGTMAQDYTINGRLVFRPQEADEEHLPMLPSFGPDTSSSFLRPSAGEIAVEINHESRGIGGGVCTVTGSRTFEVEQLSEEARQNLWLELAEDGRYKLSLGVISRYLLTPVEVVCRVARRDVRSTEQWDVAVMIGLQQGTVGENGIDGRLDPPLRLGAATITGQWSFGTSR
jgi:hypothetical protein